MKKVLFWLIIGALIISPSIILAATLLHDDFNGNIVNSDRWHIPIWKSPTDGTFVGRTQFRCSQNSPLPSANNSNAIITVETYNPTGFSFYGTDLISNQVFLLVEGIHIKVRAKMNTSTPGIVGGIFLYALKPGSTTIHDEIDFELLTNLPNKVQTNIYGNEPLGRGHPQFVSYTSGSITDYHTYEIKWQPTKVTWFIDGHLVRTDTSHVPAGPMNFHLNIWVPDLDWAIAYSHDLQPTASPSSNQVFWMGVDSVHIQSFKPAPGESSLTPILLPLLLDKTQ
jgi:Glycosyl hydrolases family 16